MADTGYEYEATEDIMLGGYLAFAKGDPVPASTVKEQKLTKQTTKRTVPDVAPAVGPREDGAEARDDETTRASGTGRGTHA